MENFQLLTDFYEVIAEDARISATHISLYLALLQAWKKRLSKSPFFIQRDTVMKVAKISRKTYNKRMKELQQYGYIKYEPSSNPFVRSSVYLKSL